MMKNILRIISLLLVAVVLATALSGCKEEEHDATSLSFKDAAGYDYLKKLDGEYVTISGYMATSSPVDGSFIFLMNLPYQSCPFCVPNTQQLANTMAVYAAKGTSFDYTDRPVKITGRPISSSGSFFRSASGAGHSMTHRPNGSPTSSSASS